MQIFRHLNSPIDHNLLDNVIADFKRYDGKEKTVPSKATVDIIIRQDKLKSDLGSYHHGAMFSTVSSTFLKAI